MGTGQGKGESAPGRGSSPNKGLEGRRMWDVLRNVGPSVFQANVVNRVLRNEVNPECG